jgi:hypothetical protein
MLHGHKRGFQCPAFGQARHIIFGQFLFLGGLEWSVAQLWKIIWGTRYVCPEFLPGQAEIQAESDEPGTDGMITIFCDF